MTTSCTPEGGLEALADSLFTRYRFQIPCQGEGGHTPLTKDKAGRKDASGRLYRYWTCSRCQPRTKRNCRSYINQAENVLGRQVVSDLASILLNERRAAGSACDLLEAWLHGKLTLTSTDLPSRKLSKRKADSIDIYSDPKRFCPPSKVHLEQKINSPNDEALRVAYTIREAVDGLIGSLTTCHSLTPAYPTIPTSSAYPDHFSPGEVNVNEIIAQPTPITVLLPTRTPLQTLPNDIAPTSSPNFDSSPDFDSSPNFDSSNSLRSSNTSISSYTSRPFGAFKTPSTSKSSSAFKALNASESSNAFDPSESTGDSLDFLVSRFRRATSSCDRNATRKEAKKLGLTARFEAARVQREKPPSS